MSNTEWRAWVLVGAFSAVLFLATAATYNALGVVLPAMVREEGWSWTEAGFGFTLLGAATGGSSFIPPILIRRLGVRATLVCGAAVMAAGFACLAETRSALVYFGGATLCGTGYQMLALIPGTHVLAALFPRRAFPFGIYFTSAAAGGVVGPLLAFGLTAVFHGDWRAFWLTQALVTLAVGGACAVLVGGRRWLAEASEKTDRALASETAAKRSAVYRTPTDWSVAEALRTPQFYVLLAAYFGHLLIGATVAGVSVAHLSQRGVAEKVAVVMLSVEALMQGAGRSLGGLIGDRIDPKYLLMAALASLAAGSAALSIASDYPTMLVYAVGSGVGFGLTLLAVTVLLLNYYGRRHNLEIFSLTCLIGAVSALGPTIAGGLRDLTGSFSVAFQLFAGVIVLVLLAVAFMRPPRPARPREATGSNVSRSTPKIVQAALMEDERHDCSQEA
ncbi:MAG: MFS transporter [Caulobacteraceae bacterium]|nr:MFS transporter [Caulobacteraceae bacterium]